jgi:hypothetical protein
MPGRGLQHLPLNRIPEKWDPVWFASFCKDVLALADARNSVGDGVEITGLPNEVATFSVNADIQALLEQTFVLAQPSGFLEHERTLAGETGVLQIIDGGPDANITVEIIANGIPLGKLRQLSNMAVLGNSEDGAGDVRAIQASADGEVLCVQAGALGFTATPVWSGDHKWVDNVGLVFGTDDDVTVEFDGTDFSISATGGFQLASTGELEVAADSFLVTTPGVTVEISDDGEILIDGDPGDDGQVIVSRGIGVPVEWADQSGGGGGGSETIVKQATTLTITSDNTFQTTSLSASLSTGVYLVEARIWTNAHATPDMQIQFQFTGTIANLNGRRTAFRMSSPATSEDQTVNIADTVYTMDDTSRFYIEYAFLVEVSAGGTLAVYARQVTSSTTSVEFLAGSMLRITKTA